MDKAEPMYTSFVSPHHAFMYMLAMEAHMVVRIIEEAGRLGVLQRMADNNV